VIGSIVFVTEEIRESAQGRILPRRFTARLGARRFREAGVLRDAEDYGEGLGVRRWCSSTPDAE